MSMAAFGRDPVSEWFDSGARDLLRRAYARPGSWVGTRIADPRPAHLARAAALGINLAGPDPVRRLPGRGLNARSRWARGFVRALYYQHRWHSGQAGGGWRPGKRTVPRAAVALEVEVGRKVPGRGIIPAGRAVRVRVHPGGHAAAVRAARQLPDSRRIYSDDGATAARWADADARDY